MIWANEYLNINAPYIFYGSHSSDCKQKTVLPNCLNLISESIIIKRLPPDGLHNLYECTIFEPSSHHTLFPFSAQRARRSLRNGNSTIYTPSVHANHIRTCMRILHECAIHISANGLSEFPFYSDFWWWEHENTFTWKTIWKFLTWLHITYPKYYSA